MPTPMRHYVSSSDSDHGIPPVTEKKKKKKKPPPQAQIDRIWKEFVSKKPSKAVSVLPFANPVPAPATSSENGGNELLAAGYERAVQECRLKVRKIISECRRVNLRYRDPVFDLDWDLRTRKGNCLNHLGEVSFDISRSRNWSAFSNIPKAVKRVHEIFEKPTFMAKTSYSDIKQGALGNCWLMASLTGLANATDLIKRTCVEYDTRIGIYGFVFFRDGEWVYTIIDDKLYLKSPCWDHPSLQREILQQIDREDVERVYRQTYQTGSKALFFAQCKNQNETWLPLLEKAYAKCHGDYASLEGGWIGEGLEDLTGGVTTELLASDILDVEGFWDNELSKVNEEFLFGCSTGLLEPGYGERAGIQECHAYTIMEARTIQKGEKKGTRLLKLRNPWGKVNRGNWEGAWSDGSKEWTEEVLAELGHHFGTDSVFWISYEDLLRKYTHFDRTRLFRDPDWRCSQKWAGVVVPWKAHFEEQFRFKLTKETPLVLTLSQLDNRFFKGLKGQYKFHVHFRLHEKGRLDDDDYIVRSHGNYLMNRSVGIELPSMLPGDYSVFVSVTARRNTEKPTVEEVVKRETRKRSENEKLAQVGQAYDQAHAKAAGHLEQLAAVRKKRNQKRASECRKDIRQHAWEKRHIERVVKKKQAKKNKAKKDAKLADRKKRREAAEAELKKKIEAEEAERKKQEEAEAAEKKKQEEAEAAEKKKQEEAEEADRKRREAEDEAKKTKDQAVQTEPNPDTGTEDKSGARGQSKEAGPPNQAETELAKDANRSTQHGVAEKLADEGQAEQAGRKDTEGFSDSEPEQDTPQGTPDAEKASLSIAPSVQGDDEQAESGSDKGNSSKAKENSGAMAGDSASKPDVAAAQNKTEGNATAGPESGGEDKTCKDQDSTLEEKSEEAAKKGAENETAGPKTDDKETSKNDPEPKPSEAKDDGNKSVDSKPSTEVQEKDSKESPKDEKPKDEEPKDEKPKDEEPKDEKPKDEEPKDEKPKDEKPKDESPSKPLPKLEVQISDSEVSSASPVTDWEELYSSDNTCRKPIKERGWIPVPVATSSSSNTTKKDDESDNENLPEPWNAICIVGFRVYSKDEGLELGVVVDGKVDGWPEDNTENKEEEDKEGSGEDDEEKAEDEDGRDGDDESSDGEEDETEKKVLNDNDAKADD